VARSYLIAGAQLVAALAVIPVALTHDLATAIACITLAVAASMGANAVYFAVNVDIIPARAASAFGIMNLAFAISGVLAPYITGLVLNPLGSFVDAFWLMAALAFSSVIVVLVFHHPDRDRLGKSAEHVNVKSVNKSISYDH
jgi:MFS transporter, ACS family, hexuronate transporter